MTLVFPESTLDSPASMFGHTLLRVDDETEDRGGLLGYAIDFSGDIGDDGLLAYLAKGPIGVYPGRFGVGPFYEKLERYADWENRDIWEYTLDFDEREIDFLLRHLWELRGVSFAYYFFDDNCSYQLLRLLEVARPTSRLSEGFPLTVIPVDTVRAVTDAGWVESARYRPSPATKLRHAARALDGAARGLARDVAAGRVRADDARLAQLPAAERAAVLTVAYRALRYAYVTGNVGEDESRSRGHTILVARSRLGTDVVGDPLAEMVPEPRVRPEAGHATARASLGGGIRDGDAYVEVRFRAALHDFMDAQPGYPAGTQVSILDTRVRYFPGREQVRLEELVLLDIASRVPQSTFFRSLAWRADTGLRTRMVRDGRGLDAEPVWRSHGAAGLAIGWGPWLGYGFGDVTLDVGPALQHDVSFGPGATAGATAATPGDRFRSHVFAAITRFATGDRTTWYRAGIQNRLTLWSQSALSFDCAWNRQDGEEWLEGGLAWSYFF